MRDNDPADAPMLVRSVDAEGFVRANAAFRAKVGFEEAGLAKKPFLDWIQPGDHKAISEAIDRGEGCCRVGHQTSRGDFLEIDAHIAA